MTIRIGLKNVGPISSGSFDLAKMTVFVGPNNAGKSIGAICAYAASLPAERGALFDTGIRKDPARPGRQVLRFPRISDEKEWAPAAEAIVDVLRQIQEGKPSTKLRIPQALAIYAQQRIKQSIYVYADHVAGELERCFGTRLSDVARRHETGPSEVTIRSQDWPWSVKISLRGKRRISLGRRPAYRKVLLPSIMRIAKDVDAEPVWLNKENRVFLVSDVAWHIPDLLLSKEFPPEAQYLPAERAGLLQGHRLLVGAVLRRAPYAGIERMPDMPPMSGVITDFLEKIVLAPDEASEEVGSYELAARRLEQMVMGGHIDLRESRQGYLEITYRQGRHSFPLHRVSSMVTETAPLVLYLRNIVKPASLLVIEEPESHLHPQNQLLVADLINDLFNHDLRLLITTHSDYFLGALSNALRKNHSSAGGTPELGRSVDLEEVGAYVFVPSQKRGSHIMPVDVTIGSGIDESEFGRITEQLYDATAQITEEQIRAQQSGG